ncbi:MAG: DUF1841 family protein [Gammaproteobacteria bacterium]|nr:MAG: DUF1841 family protein [Gammaproteobacteria bacterium]
MFGQDREQLRRFFQTSWEKRLAGREMSALERIVAEVVAQHPEYHEMLQDPDAPTRDFPVENGQTNPFLHMGMHVTLAEQLGSDRPAGIRELYRLLAERAGDAHAAEHQMMECLGRVLWEAQRSGQIPDEAEYLGCLRRLVLK